MSEVNQFCPNCPKRCPLSAPGCGRGERYVRELRGESVPEGPAHEGERRGHGEGQGGRHGERHGHHEHEHEHRGGHRHGHEEH